MAYARPVPLVRAPWLGSARVVLGAKLLRLLEGAIRAYKIAAAEEDAADIEALAAFARRGMSPRRMRRKSWPGAAGRFPCATCRLTPAMRRRRRMRCAA